MKKYVKFILFAAVAAALALLVYLSRRPKDLFEYAEVEYSDISSYLTVSGKITSSKEIDVQSRIVAYVSEIYVKSGDQVKKGQLLMTLEAIPDIALLEGADTEVELARIALNQAELDFKRAQTLYKNNAISRKEFENAKNALAVEKERMKLSENKRQIIARGGSGNNDASKILSPIDGIVSEVVVREGQTVSAMGYGAQGSTLCRVADNGPLLFKGNVDEVDVASIKVGMPAKLVLGALPTEVLSATVSEIESFGRSYNGYTQFEIKAEIDSIPQGVVLRSGYSANADIEIETAQNVLCVPMACVKFDDKLNPYVIRLVPGSSPKKQKWETVPVVVGISDKLNIQIVSGLNENDLVQSKFAGKI